MKYKTIVADPPWPYKAAKAMPIREGLAKYRGTASGHGSSVMQYGAMSIQQLCDLQVKEFTAPDAHLYLWTTNAFMREAYELADAWGFAVKTILTWVKTKKDGTPSMKMGYYYRGATEHVLFAVQGHLRLRGPCMPTAFYNARLPHSVKPDSFYDMVEQQSPTPRLELFSRRRREGWHCWGNQVESDIEL